MEKRKWTNEEIKDYRKIHGAFFYCNKEDSNFFIPKGYGIGFGWTVNWANPFAWTFVVVIIGIIFFRRIF